jgi:F420-0:gamma-glutamyl ligase
MAIIYYFVSIADGNVVSIADGNVVSIADGNVISKCALHFTITNGKKLVNF